MPQGCTSPASQDRVPAGGPTTESNSPRARGLVPGQGTSLRLTPAWLRDTAALIHPTGQRSPRTRIDIGEQQCRGLSVGIIPPSQAGH